MPLSINDLKARWHDVPGIQSLSLQRIAGRDTYSFGGKIVAVDPRASLDEIESAIRAAASSPAIAQMPAGTPVIPANAEQAAEATPVPSASLLPSLTIQSPKVQAMTNPAPGSFAASLKAMMDDARAGVEQARKDGLATVQTAVGKLNEAKTATAHVAGTMAKTIEDEAASVMSELGQISNDLGA